MRPLLDTHALLWFLNGDETLSAPVRDQIADPANDVFVSVVSLWGIALKLRIGKLRADLRSIAEDLMFMSEDRNAPAIRSRSSSAEAEQTAARIGRRDACRSIRLA